MKAFSWLDVAHGAIVVGGKRLEAAAFGPPPDKAPTIVLLHEGLGCVALWREFPQKLSQATGFGVFAYSRAGYGRSDLSPLPWPLDYMTREAKTQVPRVLDAIGAGDCVLLGHSDGASIAAIYAGAVGGARVRGLVLVAPHFFTEPAGLASIAAAREAYATSDLKARLAKYHAHVDVAFHGWCDSWLDPRFRDWNIADCLDGLRVPALVIQGEQDQYGTIRQVEAVVARSPAPVEVAVIPACGHSPHLEAPDRTLAAVAAFCARLQNSRRT